MSVADVAYFSMEVALSEGMPTYAGGLGVLAGDMLRSSADLGLPIVAVSLLHRAGYFFQQLGTDGWQREQEVRWSIDDHARLLDIRASLQLEGRDVSLAVWRHDVVGSSGHVIPVFLLDADVDGNSDEHRRLTDGLYAGDQRYRLCQEAILGIGGVRMLRALGYADLKRFHMNEGHSSLLALELLQEALLETHGNVQAAALSVRQRCVFTTHTPVAAGHDQFPRELVQSVLHQECTGALNAYDCSDGLNMTELALSASHYVNGVAKRHGEISQQMFPNYEIDWITNGVHGATWTSPPFAKLYDDYVPGWRADPHSLRSALAIPAEELWQAHRAAKWHLLEWVNRECNSGMDVDFLTLGFARRATAYKRPTLLLEALDVMQESHTASGPIQVIFAGKAHPKDEEGKRLIQSIFESRKRTNVRICYLANYDLALAKQLVAGVDVWVNTPHPPLEASGTSGMKAAFNGVPSLSVLDGWWIEGCIENVTGWGIGDPSDDQHSIAAHAARLREKLELRVLPMFYERRAEFIQIMQNVISLNASFFNTHRMLQQYTAKAYLM